MATPLTSAEDLMSNAAPLPSMSGMDLAGMGINIKQEIDEDEDLLGGDDLNNDGEEDEDSETSGIPGIIKPAAIENILSDASDDESEEESEEEVSEYEDEQSSQNSQNSTSQNGRFGGANLPPFNQKGFFGTVGNMSTAATSSGERKKREAFTLQQKLEVLKFLEGHSVNATSRYYKVDPKSIRLWRSQKSKIEQTVQEELLAKQEAGEDEGVTPRKRISGAGRKKRGQSQHDAKKVIVEIEENPNKRHRRSIKLSDKVEIIRLVEHGQTQSDVARSLGISQSTVQTIWSNKMDILERNQTPKRKRKNLHWKKYSTIDSSLFTWYRQCRETGVPVEGKMLLDKAVEFAEYYKQPDFKAQSQRWVEMFKKRHSITDVDRLDRLLGAAANSVALSSSLPDHHHPPHHLQQQHLHQQMHHQIQQQQHPQSSQPPPQQSHHLQHQHHHPPQPQHVNPVAGGGNLGPSSAHDLVPDFDLSSLPGLMAGLYPPDPGNPTGAPPSSSSAPSGLPTPNFNAHIPIVPILPVTTCDSMKYVELIRSWISTTFGEQEETLNNHLNAIENAILKRRMTEMLAPANNHR